MDRDGILLEAKGLRKRFGAREVVRGVDLSVGAGEIVGLLGKNGAGKTTTFRMVMGLLRPNAGSVSFRGEDVSALPMYRRARLGVGYLAQEPSVFGRMTAEDNIRAVLEMIILPDAAAASTESPGAPAGEARREKEEADGPSEAQGPALSPPDIPLAPPRAQQELREERLEKLIAEFGLEKVRRSRASTLSGGERRRLEIARALATDPVLLLFDEPFSGIDPIAVFEIQEIIYDLKARGLGVLLTDHNVRETLAITDRAYIMEEGEIWLEGTPEELVNHPDARRLYLGEKFKMDVGDARRDAARRAEDGG
jgi:lipopolysaccharide export system ATP-binding protein